MSSPLPHIESLLQEFYEAPTTNARKREIEQQLVAYKSQPEAWQICLRATVSFNVNQYVWFYCTSTLEHVITRRWSQLSASDRIALRDTLWQTYARLDVNNIARRQRDTIAQLIVLMGKREFPDEHPNYMLHCMELIKSKFQMGICLMRITSEEVVSAREDLTTARKTYFHSCISMCIPDVMELLTKFLLIAVCHVNGKDIHSIPNMDYNLLQTLPNDNQLSTSVVELLTCVQHLVSWIPTHLISEYCLMSILDLSTWRSAHAEISYASLSVLNELLYLQKMLPYTPTLMMGVNSLLSHHNATKQQNEIYSEKFRELLRLYTSKYHAKIMHENDLFEAYVKSLFFCTATKNGALDFTEKLEIWTPIINGLTQQPQKFVRFHDILQQLVIEITKRIQFEHNSNELELLDNEVVENNQHTEWQHFLNQCIECIALIAESRPNLVFAQVYNFWARLHALCLSLETDIDTGKMSEALRKVREPNFYEHVRDLTTICQTLARLATVLDLSATVEGVATETQDQLHRFMEHLLVLLKFLASNKLHTLQTRLNCQTDLNLLYAQVLMSIRCILLLPTFPPSEALLHNIFSTLGAILLPKAYVDDNVVHAAASELLVSICSVIRPKFLLDVPTIVNFMQAGYRLTHLEAKVATNIYISLISYLILPWKHVHDSEQDYARRNEVLQEYVNGLTQQLQSVDFNDETKVAAMLHNLLHTLGPTLEFFKDANNNSKDMLTSVFKTTFTKVLQLYEAHAQLNSTIAIDTADFSLRILRSLSAQLGSQFIKEMIRLFIRINSKSGRVDMNRYTVMEKIVRMFQVVVEQPGNVSNALLPNILDYTMEQVLPYLQSNELNCSELPNLAFTLFDSILNHKWQYFYKSQVQNTTLLNGSMHEFSENLHPEHFLAIMNCYGMVLCNGNDPNLVRNVLLSMQHVNDRWRLYKRALFRDNLLTNFLRAIISVLTSGEGGLHFDLLASALYAMGIEDAQRMREAFSGAGFPMNMKLIDDVCSATDIPTFSQKLALLMQDAHHLSLLEQD